MWCMRQIQWPSVGRATCISKSQHNALQHFSLLEQSHSGCGSQEEGCGFVFFRGNCCHGLSHAGVHCIPGFIGTLLAKLCFWDASTCRSEDRAKTIRELTVIFVGFFSTAASVTSLLSTQPSCIEMYVLVVPSGVLQKYSGFQTHANEANWHLLTWPERGNFCLPLLSSDKQPALTRDSTVHYLRHHPRFVLLLTRPWVHVDSGAWGTRVDHNAVLRRERKV